MPNAIEHSTTSSFKGIVGEFRCKDCGHIFEGIDEEITEEEAADPTCVAIAECEMCGGEAPMVRGM